VTECFFCRFLGGEESEHNKLEDVVQRTPGTTAFVSPRAWPANAGNVIVIPNEHVSDLESAEDAVVAELFIAAKRVAIAMRTAYDCPATSVRQHNGAAAGQEIDHLHVHVFPRYDGDRLYDRTGEHRFAPPAERAEFARRLRSALVSDTLGV
jgi:histidine triad (HIT) family protein